MIIPNPAHSGRGTEEFTTDAEVIDEGDFPWPGDNGQGEEASLFN